MFVPNTDLYRRMIQRLLLKQKLFFFWGRNVKETSDFQLTTK